MKTFNFKVHEVAGMVDKIYPDKIIDLYGDCLCLPYMKYDSNPSKKKLELAKEIDDLVRLQVFWL